MVPDILGDSPSPVPTGLSDGEAEEDEETESDEESLEEPDFDNIDDDIFLKDDADDADDESAGRQRRHAGRRRKSAKSADHSIPVRPILEPLTMAEIERIFDESEHLGRRFQVLFAFFYLTGARVGELSKLRKNDLKVDGDFIRIKIATEKNPHEQYREIAIGLKDFPKMSDVILKWLDHLDPFDYVLSNCRRNKAKPSGKQYFLGVFKNLPPLEVFGWYRKERMIIRRSWHPHYFRHCRLTHLAQHYHASADQLKYFAGWSSYEPAKAYIKMDWTAVADLIAQKKIPQNY
jgi:integrase